MSFDPSLPGSASRLHVELLAKPRDSTSVLKALPGKLDIKRDLVFSIFLPLQIDYLEASRSEPCVMPQYSLFQPAKELRYTNGLFMYPYICFISFLYLDLYVLGDDALIS